MTNQITSKKDIKLIKIDEMTTEVKMRIIKFAIDIPRKTNYKGKSYGVITNKMLDVLKTLLFSYKSESLTYDKIAIIANCSHNTVVHTIKTLKLSGLLAYIKRRTHVHISYVDGIVSSRTRVRVVRMSNDYYFCDQETRTTLHESLNNFHSAEIQIYHDSSLDLHKKERKERKQKRQSEYRSSCVAARRLLKQQGVKV